MLSLLRHKACRQAWESLVEELNRLRTDHQDLQARFVRLQGRLAKYGALSEPKSTGSEDTDLENGGRAAALNAAIRAKDHLRVKEIRAHVPRQG